MADISKVTLPNGSTYDIKDAAARTQISSEADTRKAADDSINNSINNLKSNLTGAMHYVGVTTTPITDGKRFSYNPASQTEDPSVIDISGHKYKPKSGDVVIYQNKEFVATVSFTDTIKNVTWNEFGSTGSLKALAFKDSASGTVTPSGTISTPTFTGTAEDIYIPIHTDDIRTSITLSSTLWELDPATKKYKDPNVGTGGMLVKVQPRIDWITFGDVNTNASHTPIKQVDTIGTLPTFSATVNDETLSFNFNAGSLPTTEDIPVVTDVSTTISRPILAVTPFTIASYNHTDTILEHGTYTPQGTISQPTFTGNASNVTVK